MRPATLALGLLALAGAAVGVVAWRNGTEDSRAWRRLLELHGTELHADPFGTDAAPLFARFGAAASPAGKPDLFEPSPWYVFRLRPDTPDERVVLLAKRNLIKVPGAEHFSA